MRGQVSKVERITLGHGSGGRLSHSLIRDLFLAHFKNPILQPLEDSAIFEIAKGRMAYTTDSYVVDPIFFPGGDIGRLAVCGTVNDLAMKGAVPLYLSVSFIIEEGFSISELRKILRSMKDAADEAGVRVVCGDTKVVGKGSADKVFITTSGVGMVPDGVEVSPSNIELGDQVILSGTIGDHGVAILSERAGLGFASEIRSDTTPLNHIISRILKEGEVHALRDPTRGGIATSLNELSMECALGIRIYEERIPVRDEVRGACELLGIDPLYVANEGKFLAITPKASTGRILSCIKGMDLGADAEVIGEVTDDIDGVVLVTRIGGRRIVDMLTGEQLPRIC
jgi:hydrogenase expression/formation protein HypE